jgi:DNA-binding MarR family transcriptional regulator
MSQADSSRLFDKVPHLGEVRQVTLAQASLDKRLVRRLSRSGGTTTAAALRRVAGNSCSQREVDESLARLFEWGMVTLEAGETSRTILVTLTEAGSEQAQRIADLLNRQVASEILAVE